MGSQSSKANSTSSSGNEETTSTKVLNKALSSTSKAAKILPTGILFLFQMFSHVLSNEGDCNKLNKVLTGVVIGILGIACFIMCFVDSFTTSNGKVYYGIATTKGLWTTAKTKPSNNSSFKIKFMDFVHAILATTVFGVLSLTDKNVVNCFYPSAESSIKKLYQALPLVAGAVASALCVIFPSSRHGVAHPVTNTD